MFGVTLAVELFELVVVVDEHLIVREVLSPSSPELVEPGVNLNDLYDATPRSWGVDGAAGTVEVVARSRNGDWYRALVRPYDQDQHLVAMWQSPPPAGLDVSLLLNALEPFGIGVLISDFDDVFVSARFEQLGGISADEVAANPATLLDLVHPDDRPRVADVFNRIQHQPMSKRLFIRYKVNDDYRWLVALVSSSPTTGVFAALADATGFQQLQRERYLLQSVADKLDEAVTVTDAEGNVLFLNDPARKLLEEITDEDTDTVIGPDVPAPAAAEFESGETWEGKTVVRLRDGSFTVTRQLMTKHVDLAGRILGFSTVWKDLSDMREREAAAREEKALLEARITELQCDRDQLVQHIRATSFELENLVSSCSDMMDMMRLTLESGGGPPWLKEMSGVYEQVDKVRSQARAGELPALGFDRALDNLLARLQHLSSVEAVTAAVELPELPVPAEAFVFEVVEALLDNVNDHANASWVSVTVRHDNVFVYVDVVDDGVGVAVEMPVGGRTGPGPGSLHARCERLGGRIGVRPRGIVGGAVAFAEVPIRSLSHLTFAVPPTPTTPTRGNE